MKVEDFEKKQAQMSDKELIELVAKEISDMCRTGCKTFTMSVPPRVKDSDMLLCEMLRRFTEKVSVA